MKRKLLQPANLLLLIGLVFGIAISVAAPFGTGFDEEPHLARVYDISGLNLLPNRSIYDKTVYFAEFHTLTYRRFFYRDQAAEMFTPQYFGVRANYDSMAIESTMSIYPPLMFFPQAVAAGVGWRLLDLPLILLLPRRVFDSRAQFIGMWAVTIVMTFFHAAWIITSFTNTSLGADTPGTIFTSVFSQLGQYLGAFWRSFLIYYKELFASTFAAYGYWEGKVPALVYWLVGAVLVLTLFAERKDFQPTKGTRAFMLGLMLMAWFGVLVMYTAGKFTFDSQETVLMVQGRYLIAFLPLGLLALVGLAPDRFSITRAAGRLIAAGIILYQGFFLWGLYAHYYTPCGPSALARADCRLPAYQNLEIFEPPQVELTEGVVLEQGFENTCADLRSVEVLIGDISEDAVGGLVFSLLTPDGEAVLSRTVEISALTPKNTLKLDVTKGIDLSRGIYIIQLDAAELRGEVGVGIREPDVYPVGSLNLSGSVLDGDAVFYYTCAPKGFIPQY